MTRSRKYSDEELIQKAKEVKSISGLLRAIGLNTKAGNYFTMRRKIHELKINTAHWTGQLWAKGERLKHWDTYKSPNHVRRNLLKALGHKCEGCGRASWRKCEIPIELHHVDGDRTNNAYENLRLLCPNCHALTHNWRNKKREATTVSEWDESINKKRAELLANMPDPFAPYGMRKPKPPRVKKVPHKIKLPRKIKPPRFCKICNKRLKHKNLNYCSYKCAHFAQRKCIWPPKEILIADIKAMPWLTIGKKYGVSDNAVRKWAKAYNLSTKRKEICNPECLSY